MFLNFFTSYIYKWAQKRLVNEKIFMIWAPHHTKVVKKIEQFINNVGFIKEVEQKYPMKHCEL